MAKTNRYPPPWPDAALPLPRVEMWQFDLSGNGWLTRRHGTFELATPPLEMHLREMREVDLHDPTTLRDLCATAGAVVPATTPARGVVDPQWPSPLAERHARSQADNVGAQLDLPAADWANRPPSAVHVSEVALRVVTVQLLVSHAERALREDPVAPVWSAVGVGAFEEDALSQVEDAAHEFAGIPPLSSEDPETVAWAWFAHTINRALVEFSPRFRTFGIESEPDTSDVTSAFGAACSFVFNDLHERVPYKFCADETCGRMFKRQLGRAEGKNKPRSSGVEYCTWRHAMNQSRRERRRQARQEI